jgi:signal transduction histidine kinase/CheY-like chemotaxis protein/HPt (histidine-containing phosphotransfer) domain-containing protein
MSVSWRYSLTFRVSAAMLAAVAGVATVAALQLALVRRDGDRGAARTARAAASSAELADVRTRLLAAEAALQEMRSAPPGDSVHPSAAGRAARHLADLHRTLDGYGEGIEGTAESPAGEGAEVRSAERRALERARMELAGLERLNARIRAGERPSPSEIARASAAVSAPLQRLVDLSRYRLDAVRRDERRAAGDALSSALAWIAVAAVLAAALGLAASRWLARRLRTVGALSRSVAAGEAWSGGIPGGPEDECREMHLALATNRAALETRDASIAALAAEVERGRAELAEARHASESKTRFVNHVSHEFRTPLSSIIGFSSLLAAEHERLPAERRGEYVEIVLRNARHLLHVVNDLLNLSKVEAGTLEVTLAPVYLPEVVRAAAASLGPQASERGVEIAVVDHARHFAVADTGRLRQVLLNLLENAIKYSPPATPVEVRVSSGRGTVRVEVRDRGPGIEPADQDRLFKEFSRIPLPGTPRIVGAGLGLALSKQLVELMRGEIGVDSAPGEGSIFWVELPAGDPLPGDGAEREERLPAPPRGQTVAVVDDDPDIRAFAATILSRAGYSPVTDDGSPGVAVRLGGAQPAVILLDLGLAGRTGADVLAEVRAHPRLVSVPAVAFTAANEVSGQEAAEAGFQGYLAKPVEPGVLVQRVEEALSDFSSSPSNGREGALATLTEPPAGGAVVAGSAPEGVDEGTDGDYLAPLRARFLHGLGGRLEALEDRVRAGDAAGTAREAHKLRGAAAGYGLDELSALAGAVEDALGKPGATAGHPAVAALLERLRGETGAE